MPVVPDTALIAVMIDLISDTSVTVAVIAADPGDVEASLPSVKVMSPAVVILCNLTLVTADAVIPVRFVTAFTPDATSLALPPNEMAAVVEPICPDKVNV